MPVAGWTFRLPERRTAAPALALRVRQLQQDAGQSIGLSQIGSNPHPNSGVLGLRSLDLGRDIVGDVSARRQEIGQDHDLVRSGPYRHLDGVGNRRRCDLQEGAADKVVTRSGLIGEGCGEASDLLVRCLAAASVGDQQQAAHGA